MSSCSPGPTEEDRHTINGKHSHRHTHSHTQYLLQSEALVVRTKHSPLQVDQRGAVRTQPGTGNGQVVPGQTLWFGGRRTHRDQSHRADGNHELGSPTEMMLSPQFPSRSSLNNADLKQNIVRLDHDFFLSFFFPKQSLTSLQKPIFPFISLHLGLYYICLSAEQAPV